MEATHAGERNERGRAGGNRGLGASLGAAILARRRECGWSQEELAARVAAAGDPAFRQSDVSRLEKGRVGLPRRDRLERLARVLGLPPGELLALSGWSGAGGAFPDRGPGGARGHRADDGSAGVRLLVLGPSADDGRGPMHADGTRPHVLVVNDRQEMLDLLRDLLEDEGYRVTTSLAALDLGKVKALAPDAIVQDLLFGQTQEVGWHFLTMVRLDPALAHVPVVLCTAALRTVRDPEMAARLERLGVRVVLKPFAIADLLAALEEGLAGRPASAEAAAGRKQ